MARCKQTARKVPIETVTVDISETTPINFSPSAVPLSGKETLRRLDPSDPAFSRYTLGAGSSITTDAMAAERWPLPSDLKMEIDLHNEPGLVSWIVDYFKRGRNLPEIVLRIKGAEVERKETKAKDLGIVCFTRPNDVGLEIWFEVLKNKQIKRTILPMATWDHDDLLPKGKGGVQDISDDIGTNDNYSEAISNLRFKLLLEKKSQSSMWDFLELCHKYSVDLSQMGKVAQTLVFKKHSDKNFDFVDYMEKKGLKITLPSTETNPSGAAGTETSDEGSKLKRKAHVKKLNVVTPKKPKTGTVEAPKKSTTGTAEAPRKSTGTVETPKAEAPKKSTTGSVEAPKKSTTGSAEAPRKSTGTVEAPKLKKGPTREVLNLKKKGTHGVTPEVQASKLISATSADTTGQKTKTIKFIRPTKPQSTLPSNQVGSSSGRTSSTANAPGPDNTTTSPGQSVQLATVNPNGHSGDGGSVVDSGKKPTGSL
ncbi:hypothetical protein R1sor_007449 [Riccia sorocarpa]|uniref:Uncharacterized protein n=1 Tax=Riccia sorocarpa TaxID=122646 RepID=A0ABD3HQH4_9MARC